MDQLVILHEQQAVTSSTNLAQNFGKRHDNVLRDIEGLKKDVLNFEEMFFEASEPDNYNRPRRVYLMNRDGFTLLAMGFTGPRALDFKLKYISAFNQLEAQVKNPPISSTQALLLAALEQEKKIELVSGRLDHLENTMRIDGGQQFRIQASGKRKVLESLGGTDSSAYFHLKKRVFSMFWNEFKKYFEIPRYGDLPKVRFDEALQFINEWSPNTSMRMEIKNLNNFEGGKVVDQ